MPPTAPETLRQSLRAALSADGHADSSVVVRESAGPLGTTLVTARPTDGPPGVGWKQALVDSQGRAYGTALADGLAEFAANHRWAEQVPAAASVVKVINHLVFDGLLDTEGEPDVRAGAHGGLEVEFTRVTQPSGERDRVTVRIPPRGAVGVSVAALPSDPEPIPMDGATALTRAIDKDDALEIMGAIGALVAPHTPRAAAALARAAMLGNDTLACEALEALGTDRTALDPLRRAMASASPEWRSMILELADELHGSDVAEFLST